MKRRLIVAFVLCCLFMALLWTTTVVREGDTCEFTLGDRLQISFIYDGNHVGDIRRSWIVVINQINREKEFKLACEK